MEKAEGGLGGVEAPAAVLATRLAVAGVADDLGERQVVHEFVVPIEPERAADRGVFTPAGGTDGEEGVFLAGLQPAEPGLVSLVEEGGGLIGGVGGGRPRPVAAGDPGVAEEKAVGDGGDAPRAQEGRGPGPEQLGIGGGGGVGGVEGGDGGGVVLEQMAGAEAAEAEGLDVVVAGEKRAAVGVGFRKLGQGLGHGLERGGFAPARVDGIDGVAEETERGALSLRESRRVFEKSQVLVDIGHDDDGKGWADIEERVQR